jgi:hypothetical protein
VNEQLRAHLSNNCHLSTTQHGFIEEGRSTLINLLQCDEIIEECLAANHTYDIISFDFQKAFDKISAWLMLLSNSTSPQ